MKTKRRNKIESLDDLFDDVEEPETKKVEEAPMLPQDEEDDKKKMMYYLMMCKRAGG